MNFFSDGANSTFSRLLLNEFPLENLFELLEFVSAGFPFADIETIEPTFSFKDIGFKHLIKQLVVFGVQR